MFDFTKVITDFESANDLERMLMAAQQGQLPVVSFMDKLLTSQVFVLLNKDPGPSGKWDNTAAPMVLTNQTGDPVLAVFTAPERSAEWPRREPSFRFGLLTDFAWLLRGIAPDVGIVINPGLKVGLEMPASSVVQLRARVRQ